MECQRLGVAEGCCAFCCLGLHRYIRLVCIAQQWILKLSFQLVTGGMLQEADWMLREGVEPGSNPASRAIGYRQVRARNNNVLVIYLQ